MMMNKVFKEINSPSFIVFSSQVIENIRFFKNKFLQQNILFRPHFKTHQNKIIAQLFYNEGIRNITVSNMDMAEEFSSINWHDITIAFTFNRNEINRLQKISQKVKVNIVVEDFDTLVFIENNFSGILGVFVKIDTGYNRTGIEWNNLDAVKIVLDLIASSNKFVIKGLLAHFGHTYHANSVDEIEDIYSEGIKRLTQLQTNFSNLYGKIPISVGDTPSASIIDDYGAVDEYRPGNFVYYDWMQYLLGACNINQIAAIMVCPVVAMHKSRNQIVIHGGAIHFSKEYILQNGVKNYGQLAVLKDNEEIRIVKDSFIISLSQEHGIVQCSEFIFKNYKIGDLMIFVPIHSCLSANLMKGKTLVI